MARTVVLIYGIINILGGIIGFVMGKSVMSLVAGGASGLILVWCYMIAPTRPATAYRLAGIISLILMGFWIYRINEVMSQEKSIMMPVGNLVLSIAVLGFLAYAHFAAQKNKISE
ncbi:MAG: hypothetical protein KF812_07800 [Fimbriimonadaceae bacterium]|nr:hypothetical protein [Fimbriimonadaceae bacterium]